MPKNKFLGLIFLISLISVLWLFSSFLKAGVVAWLLVLITQRFAERLDELFAKSRWKVVAKTKLALSAFVLTLIFVLLLVVPSVYLITYAIKSFDYQAILSIKPHIFDSVNGVTWLSKSTKLKITNELNNYLADMSSSESLKQVWQFMSSYLKNISGGILDLSLVVTFFFLFTLYRNDISLFFSRLLPLSPLQRNTIADNVSGTLSIVFMTVFVVAISQGIAFAVLMLFFDYNPLLLGFFTAISSVVPIFGTALVWVPVALSEFAHGNIINAIVIAVYGCVVLAFIIDNFLRIMALNKISQKIQVSYKVNEFLLFFSIAAGMAVLGFWGVLIGPALIALFIALAKALSDDLN